MSRVEHVDPVCIRTAVSVSAVDNLPVEVLTKPCCFASYNQAIGGRGAQTGGGRGGEGEREGEGG